MVTYNNIEKFALIELLTAVMEADLVIHPKEEVLMNQLLDELQINIEEFHIEDLSIEECFSIVNHMEECKRKKAKEMLIRMANCDGFVDPREFRIIESLN